MNGKKFKDVAVIVAHPDDETLWAGGTILSHSSWRWFIICLCRGNDEDRAPKFNKTLQIFGANGIMDDLDDGPEQRPLNDSELELSILKMLPSIHFDIIISHSPQGEYTRHLRHEETGKAVIRLWHSCKISARELWAFAYEDGNKKYYPRSVKLATKTYLLPENIWLKKYKIITEIYGFEKNSFEAKTTPRSESFWQFANSIDAIKWFK